MSSDLKQLLQESAARPTVEPDIEAARQRGRRLEWIRRTQVAALIVMAGVFAWVGLQVVDRPTDQPRIAEFNEGNISVGSQSETGSEVIASGEQDGDSWRLEAFASEGATCLQFTFEAWTDSQRICIPAAAAPKTAIGGGSLSLEHDEQRPFVWGVISPEVASMKGSFGEEEIDLEVYEVPDSLPVPLRVFVGFPEEIGQSNEISAFDGEGNLLETKQLPVADRDG